MGPDEKLEGGTTMLSNRHVRSITVLRVDSPVFDVSSEDGALTASDGTPPEIRGLVEPLTPDEPTWSDVRIAGGPKGIVAARAAIDGTAGSWVYALWLLERIADSLRLPPLGRARVGPAWKVPYGFGKRLEPDSERG
jgi:hypothetical protein